MCHQHHARFVLVIHCLTLPLQCYSVGGAGKRPGSSTLLRRESDSAALDNNVASTKSGAEVQLGVNYTGVKSCDEQFCQESKKKEHCSIFKCMTCGFCTEKCFDRDIPTEDAWEETEQDAMEYKSCWRAISEIPSLCTAEDSRAFAKMICPKSCYYCTTGEDRFFLYQIGETCGAGYEPIDKVEICKYAVEEIKASSGTGVTQFGDATTTVTADFARPKGCFAEMSAPALLTGIAYVNTINGQANTMARQYCKKVGLPNDIKGLAAQKSKVNELLTAAENGDHAIKGGGIGSKVFSLVVDDTPDLLSYIRICEVVLDNHEMENVAPEAKVTFLIQPDRGSPRGSVLTDGEFFKEAIDAKGGAGGGKGPAEMQTCVQWHRDAAGKRLIEFTMPNPTYLVAARIHSTKIRSLGTKAHIEAKHPDGWRPVLFESQDKGVTLEFDGSGNSLLPADGNPACQLCMQNAGYFVLPPTSENLEKAKKDRMAWLKKQAESHLVGAVGEPGADGVDAVAHGTDPKVFPYGAFGFNLMVTLLAFGGFKYKMQQREIKRVQMLKEQNAGLEKDPAADPNAEPEGSPDGIPGAPEGRKSLFDGGAVGNRLADGHRPSAVPGGARPSVSAPPGSA